VPLALAGIFKRVTDTRNSGQRPVAAADRFNPAQALWCHCLPLAGRLLVDYISRWKDAGRTPGSGVAADTAPSRPAWAPAGTGDRFVV
jgi:hypothetical protein